jgi:hypothetical protein
MACASRDWSKQSEARSKYVKTESVKVKVLYLQAWEVVTCECGLSHMYAFVHHPCSWYSCISDSVFGIDNSCSIALCLLDPYYCIFYLSRLFKFKGQIEDLMESYLVSGGGCLIFGVFCLPKNCYPDFAELASQFTIYCIHTFAAGCVAPNCGCISAL